MELGLRTLERGALARAGMRGWIPTITLRDPATGAICTLTREPEA